MDKKNKFSSKTKAYIFRMLITGVLSLALGMASLGQTLQAAARSLAAAPSNDAIAGTKISSFPFTDIVDVTEATTDTNGIPDPTPIVYGECNSDQGYSSVWYNFTPGADINVAFDTIGSNYDTVIAIWKGSPGDLTLVTCNDDLSSEGDNLNSQVGLAAKQDVKYYIEVIEFSQPAPQAQAGGSRILNFHAYLPPGVGKYDDTDTNWAYTGSWVAYSGNPGFYNSTMHYTPTVGDKASFTFSGTQFILSYTVNTNRGNIEVYVDGNRIATLNANGTLQFQQTYTSPIYPSGAHFVQIRNGGGGGGYIDVDAIEILDTSAPGVGVYDDTSGNWAYTGSWVAYSGNPGFHDSTIHYTSAEDDRASFTFNGTQFILSYTVNTNRGNIEVNVDGDKIATLNANGTLQFQQTYTSPIYPAGEHIVQIRNGGGGYIDIDAIEILNTAAPGVSKYDDTDGNWAYTGSWVAYSGNPGFYNSTIHYTATVGDKASFTFSGTQFILSYTVNTNRGSLEVYVDGDKITTLNANGTLLFQKTYTSPVYPAGEHTVKIRNEGVGGAYIDIDAIEIN